MTALMLQLYITALLLSYYFYTTKPAKRAGLCGGLTEDALREALLAQGQKGSDELYEEDV